MMSVNMNMCERVQEHVKKREAEEPTVRPSSLHKKTGKQALGVGQFGVPTANYLLVRGG